MEKRQLEMNSKMRYIYRFGRGKADGNERMHEELGGKGASLAEMTRLGLPVPPGFTISTSACRFFLEYGRTPDTLMEELEDALPWLELVQAQRLGGEDDPLLLSVRSGAAISMPGMMDTILNVGISDANLHAEGRRLAYKVGAMIELPRAAVCAEEIARQVDFLSFGTNDLTQFTFGFSRDDAHKYLDTYLELGLLKDNPFLTIDRTGVGSLMEMGIRKARIGNPKIKIGVCGEHGGDPASIAYFEEIGAEYVSCSPARIPIAQLSVALRSISQDFFAAREIELASSA